MYLTINLLRQEEDDEISTHAARQSQPNAQHTIKIATTSSATHTAARDASTWRNLRAVTQKSKFKKKKRQRFKIQNGALKNTASRSEQQSAIDAHEGDNAGGGEKKGIQERAEDAEDGEHKGMGDR